MAESSEPESHTLAGTQCFPDMPSAPASLLSRINEYFAVGGFWNPEYMEHDKVREILWDVREHLIHASHNRS